MALYKQGGIVPNHFTIKEGPITDYKKKKHFTVCLVLFSSCSRKEEKVWKVKKRPNWQKIKLDDFLKLKEGLYTKGSVIQSFFFFNFSTAAKLKGIYRRIWWGMRVLTKLDCFVQLPLQLGQVNFRPEFSHLMKSWFRTIVGSMVHCVIMKQPSTK